LLAITENFPFTGSIREEKRTREDGWTAVQVTKGTEAPFLKEGFPSNCTWEEWNWRGSIQTAHPRIKGVRYL
jgi:hypothetical protein